MTATSLFFTLALACIAGVVLVFVMGMLALTRGREKDHTTSNRMMRLRILLQAGAILFLFLAFATK